MLALALVLGNTSCLTNTLGSASSKSKKTSLSSGSPAGTTESGDFQVRGIYRSNSDPTKYLDLIGNGNGEMGTMCVSAGGTGSSSSKNTCVCSYTYTKADGAVETFEAPSSYQEADLLRCPYGSIPSGITSIRVKVRVTSSGAVSNEIVFDYYGSGVTSDMTDIGSFAPVKRFQCSDVPFIPYVLDDTFYDPIQSEDTKLRYHMNFYTTNIARSVLELGKREQSEMYGWDCGSPFRTTSDAATLTDKNYVIFSAKADDSGSKLIYPPTGSAFDRSSFLLSKSRSDTFNVPVNAMMAPEARTNVGTDRGPIGYGASPIPMSGEQEICPANVQIPEGYQWVKVWLFQGAFSPRTYVTSREVLQLNTIVCNAADYFREPAGAPASFDRRVFPQCDPAQSKATPADIKPVDTGLEIADRLIMGLNACFRLKDEFSGECDSADGWGMGCSTNPNHGDFEQKTYRQATNLKTMLQKDLQDSSFGPSATPKNLSDHAVGSDAWRIILSENSVCTKSPQAGGGFLDKPLAMNVCNAAEKDLGGLNATVDPDAVTRSLFTAIPSTISLDRVPLDNATGPADYIFVVTPDTVMTKNFKDRDTTALPYWPYRYHHADDCPVADPDNPSDPARECLISRKVTYGLKLHDINVNGDDSADIADGASGRLLSFPVCAIQKKP